MAWPAALVPKKSRELFQILLDDGNAPDCAFRGESNIEWRGLLCSFDRDTNQASSWTHAHKVCVEWWIISTFRARARNFATLAETPFLDTAIGTLQLARHYGAPTRLLDWTTSPWVALYAACDGNQEKDGVIWRFSMNEFLNHSARAWRNRSNLLDKATSKEDWAELFRDDSSSLAIVHPELENSRISAQQGFFTFSWTFGQTHEQILESVMPDRFRNKLIIPKTIKKEVMHALANMNINPVSLYQGLDGLGRLVRNVLRYDLRMPIDVDLKNCLETGDNL